MSDRERWRCPDCGGNPGHQAGCIWLHTYGRPAVNVSRGSGGLRERVIR